MSCLAPGVQAQPYNADTDENLFIMGGPFTTGFFGDTFLFWQDHYESNLFAGIGYQRFFYQYESFKLGVEAGLGLRLGTPSSAEIWGGAVARITEFTFGDLTITPALSFGLSLVTDTIGIEAQRAEALGHDVPVLFYLSPEIAISNAAQPQWEAFGRIQHRSGGFGTIAEIDGSNAAVIGLRYKF
ncbi:hypothetical protein O9Z70_13865 [Devosia sp. YIM 151766]|uniref:hypothetical protein n=1 Tax=Devosia sp. YIM 151766 TaxID=3017325 RepID=UPI00255C7750|nr:hypothetical protein [Devosia sp. YIM 151766]WIY52527.1 hypothetical protein O9Z70_13865 [Devosia sp. YIM 151766]